ncbi:restriction endonuclease subunit S [Micromonospora humida]|uniref:Restriction endonuclease subunit S n=1 Tax=Micromonospora humida TaxID=2809018 RepID=A0ABS2IVX9_9ACTN|nr:restriction endonuclease subunit S [Micromonospora humida]MBM7078101.1 restriction endonuclease subunit S [Micromonospora humida]
MTDLPPGWEWCTLGDLVTRIEAGKSFTCHPRPARDDEWGVLKVSAMTWGEFREQENKAVPEGREFDPRYEVRPGDILVSRANTEQYVGAPVLVRKCRPRLLLSDKSLRLIPSPEIDSAWLLRVLSSPSIRRQISTRASGQQDSMRNISQQALLSLELPVPPRAEQCRIVAALDEHMLHLRAAEVSLVQGVGRSVQLKAAVLGSAIAGRLSDFEETAHVVEYQRGQMLELRREIFRGARRGRPDPSPVAAGHGLDLPERWAIMSMEELTHPVRTISYGILKPGPNIPDGVPYVRVVNMRNDEISSEDLHRTSVDIDRQYSRARLAADDVLISIRGTYGRIVKVTPGLAGANITQDSARLSFLEGVDPDFACIYLRSPQVQRYLKKIARGVAVKGVNIGDLRQMPFPLPNLSEQIAIVQRVDELLAMQKIAEETVRSGLVKAKSLHRSLLAEAFAGRLVPQDPNDEPASELLARIRAERAATIPKQRTRARRTPKELAAPPTRVTGDDYQQETLPL